MASIFRFHAVYKQLRHRAGRPLGDLILGHYYDQSHFLKDFRRYTESTPRTYRSASDYGKFYIPS
jgi:AraC-like DNA-binding protein